MALSASAEISPPCTKPRLLVWAGPAQRPRITRSSVLRLNSGSHGSVSGLLRSCGANPDGASWRVVWVMVLLPEGMNHAPGRRRGPAARKIRMRIGGSHNRTVTVGPGIAPALLVPDTFAPGARGLVPPRRAGITAGGDFHPALRT